MSWMGGTSFSDSLIQGQGFAEVIQKKRDGENVRLFDFSVSYFVPSLTRLV